MTKMKNLKKKTKAELIAEIEKLQKGEDRFQRIVEHTDAGYFFIDREGIIQQVNNAWVKMYKYGSADEIVGKHTSKSS